MVKQSNKTSNLRELLKERLEKADPRRQLTAEETKRLIKLKEIADKLKRGENVQNRQLQTCQTQNSKKKAKEKLSLFANN